MACCVVVSPGRDERCKTGAGCLTDRRLSLHLHSSCCLYPSTKPRGQNFIFYTPSRLRENTSQAILLGLALLQCLTRHGGFRRTPTDHIFYAQTTTKNALDILPHLLVALALGGFFASAVSSRIGARSTFVMLFCVRGLLLVTNSLFPTLSVATVTLLVIFFAHGAGFSLVPGLVKAQQTKPTLFPYEYGQVLTAWGVAGILGNAINAAFVPSSGDATTVSFLLGLASLTFGIILYYNPAFGASAFP